MKHLGGYEKIFPIDYVDDPEDCEMIDRKERYELYETVREAALKIFENQFGVKKKVPKASENDTVSMDLSNINSPQTPIDGIHHDQTVLDTSVINLSEQMGIHTKFINTRDPKYHYNIRDPR